MAKPDSGGDEVEENGVGGRIRDEVVGGVLRMLIERCREGQRSRRCRALSLSWNCGRRSRGERARAEREQYVRPDNRR